MKVTPKTVNKWGNIHAHFALFGGNSISETIHKIASIRGY